MKYKYLCFHSAPSISAHENHSFVLMSGALERVRHQLLSQRDLGRSACVIARRAKQIASELALFASLSLNQNHAKPQRETLRREISMGG